MGGKRVTTEECISRLQKVHGDKWDYSKVNYKNQSTKIELGCSKHGSFFMRPDAAWGGQGCPRCGAIYASAYKQIDKKMDSWLFSFLAKGAVM
jgi:hypothetical protein